MSQIEFQHFHHTRHGLIPRRVRSRRAWVLRFSDTNTPHPVSGTPYHVVSNGLKVFTLRKLDSALPINVSIRAEESPPAPVEPDLESRSARLPRDSTEPTPECWMTDFEIASVVALRSVHWNGVVHAIRPSLSTTRARKISTVPTRLRNAQVLWAECLRPSGLTCTNGLLHRANADALVLLPIWLPPTVPPSEECLLGGRQFCAWLVR